MPSVTLPMSMAISVHLHWGCQGLCPPHQFKLHLTQLCSIQLPLLAPQETHLDFSSTHEYVAVLQKKTFCVPKSLSTVYLFVHLPHSVVYCFKHSLSHHDHELCLRGPNESTSIHDVQSSPIPNANTLVWLGGSVNVCRISPCTFSTTQAHKTCTSTMGEKAQYQHII